MTFDMHWESWPTSIIAMYFIHFTINPCEKTSFSDNVQFGTKAMTVLRPKRRKVAKDEVTARRHYFLQTKVKVISKVKLKDVFANLFFLIFYSQRTSYLCIFNLLPPLFRSWLYLGRI